MAKVILDKDLNEMIEENSKKAWEEMQKEKKEKEDKEQEKISEI